LCGHVANRAAGLCNPRQRFLPFNHAKATMAEKAKTTSDDHYFRYLPSNYRWSAALIIMLGTCTWGGSDIGEMDRIGPLSKAAPKQTDEA
jgi:hypothetical protein